MTILARFRSWLKAVSKRSRLETEMDTELRFHIETYADELARIGIPRDEALRRARIEFGSVEALKEDCRRSLGLRLMDEFDSDLRYGLRAMRRSPGFTLVAVLTLALGIGANTAIFSLINMVLLAALPVPQPDQLVRFMNIDPQGAAEEGYYSYPAFREFRDENRVFSGVLAFNGPGFANLVVDGRGELGLFQDVSGTYFETLKVPAVLGRLIGPQDDKVPGASPVAVISYSYWQRRFKGDPDVIGKAIIVNGHSPFTIIGVTPPRFFGLEPGYSVDVSVPIAMRAEVNPGHAMAGTPNAIWGAPNRSWLRVMARLRTNVSESAALANLGTIFAQVNQQRIGEVAGTPNDTPGFRERVLASRIELEPGSRGMAGLREQFSKPLLVLMSVVGLLLLIACGNVAQLLLARANTRQREMAMRMALGAGNLRLVRQLMTEGGLLAVGGGLLALPLAYGATRLILAGMARPSSVQFSALKIQPEPRVLAFTALVSICTVILFALAPAVRSIRFNLLPALKETSGAAAQAIPASRMAKGLVVSQVALSLILVLGAGLLVRSLRKLQHSNPGFNASNVLLVSIVPDMAGYKGKRLNEFDGEILEKMRLLPGVREASVSIFTPMGAGHIGSEAHILGYTPRPGEDLTVDLNYIGPEHFHTLDIPVVLGREFNAADNDGAPRVALINETMAHRFFGDANPIGRTLTVDDETPLSIIGVVKDAKSRSLRDQTHPTAYRPLFQSDNGGQVTFEIRTETDPGQVVSSVQRLLRSADSRIPVRRMETLSEQVNDSLLEERMVSSLSSVFGLLALLLANIGLYGLMAYTVKRRTREIGVRVALGANRRDVIWMILRETLLLVVAGLGVGAPLAAGTTRLIASQLYGITAADPPTIVMTTTLMMAVAALAGYLPARRAASVSPMEALRYE